MWRALLFAACALSLTLLACDDSSSDGDATPTTDRPTATRQVVRSTSTAVPATATAQPAATNTPAPPAPAPTNQPAPTDPPAQQPPPQTNCSPAYPGVCIPPPPPDLDCGDISARRFTVQPPDPHGFDNDGDGVGCESG